MLSNYHQENEGMSRSLSSSFQREGSSQKLDVSFNAPRHSTPVKSEQTESRSQMETSLDHCDGLSPDGSGARPKGSMPNASMSASTPPSQIQHSHHSAYLAPEKMKVGSSPYPLEVQNHSIDSSGVSQDRVTAAPQQLQATQSSTSHFPDDRVGSRKDGRYRLPPSLKLPRDPDQDYSGGGVPQGRAANRPGSGMFPTPSGQFLSADTAKPPFFKSEGRSRHHSEYCSESEASQYRTVMRRQLNMQESVEQDKEGHLKSTFKYEGSQNISPELLKTFTTFDSFSRTLQASHPQLALTGDERPADCPRFQCPDPTFKCEYLVGKKKLTQWQALCMVGGGGGEGKKEGGGEQVVSHTQNGKLGGGGEDGRSRWFPTPRMTSCGCGGGEQVVSHTQNGKLWGWVVGGGEEQVVSHTHNIKLCVCWGGGGGWFPTPKMANCVCGGERGKQVVSHTQNGKLCVWGGRGGRGGRVVSHTQDDKLCVWGGGGEEGEGGFPHPGWQAVVFFFKGL